ncbi:DUF4136 domain-containing protein [Ilyomonas limi]|uniref:DUF4136 domain-containing protein n=1 Tax=Ilyomonas limi TaxID=2575867 RepID=A0A4U3LBP2_9BACT|nr:DUF4136 domain-containing protein [Ilyomonas limi]TKK71466.1 DUF4136 domain-containing protein [Ilyomonas limi]
MKKTGALLAAAALILSLGACQKDAVSNLSTEESRIYITDHDSTVNFSSYKTYSISDSVAVIDGNQSTKQLDEADAAYITAVKKYMDGMGYTQVTKNDNPDLGVDVSHIIKTSTGLISYPDYWGYYDYYYDPYYWGYGGYDYYVPYAYDVYTVREGALSIDLLDLKNAASTNKIKLVWTGVIRGEGIFNTSTADSQVKALFDQSPYLKTND